MSDPLCSLQINSRSSIDVAAGLVDSSADLFGLGPVARVRLQALTLEVIAAVIRDAFHEAEDIELTLDVHQAADLMKITLRDKGAPLAFANGGYPPRVADLIRLGFADGLEFASEGRAGNRTEITKQIPYGSIDETFIAETQVMPPPEPVLDAQGKAKVEVRDMTANDVVGVARLFYRCYGYSAAYASAVYQPDRLSTLVRDGLHLGTVAVTAEGTIVGHVSCEVSTPDANVGEIGLFAVDPQFRKFGVGVQIGFYHATKLFDAGFVGLYTHAVTVHDRSQKAAVRSGGKEVGLVLASQPGELNFQGFDVDPDRRKSLMSFYANLGRTPERTVYVPPAHTEIAERIYAHAQLPRTVVTHVPGRLDVAEEVSEFQVNLRHDTGIARLEVRSYGEDFLSSLQAQILQLRMNRFDLIIVDFPMSDPLTSYFAGGLHELGLSFAAVMPEYRDGDVLRLQTLNNVEVAPEDIQVASEFGGYLRDFVVNDMVHAEQTVATRTRSRARMSRIYEALDGS